MGLHRADMPQKSGIFKEIYLGIKMMSLFFVFMLMGFMPLDDYFRSQLMFFSVFYSIYIAVNGFLFFKGCERANGFLSILDALFAAVFIHISRNFFYSFLTVSYIYIMFQILTGKKDRVFFYPTLFSVLTLGMIYCCPETSATIDTFLHILFMYFFAYIFHAVTKEQSELQDKLNYLLSQVENKNKSLKEMVDMDYLTKLFNHKSFYSEFDRLIDDYKNSKREFSLALMDIDNFKRINDTYGHLAGDLILKESAAIISDIAGSSHLAFRYGGEEFALLMRDTCLRSSYMICENIRKTIENHVFVINGNCIRITLSFGLRSSCNGFDTMKAREFVSAADELLYKAKNSGKNVVMVEDIENFLDFISA